MVAESPTPGEKYWFCPLYSFDCNFNSVNLTNGINIIRLPGFFRDEFDDSIYRYGPSWSKEGYVEWGAAFPSYVYGEKSIDEDFYGADELSFDLLSSLRLCHKGMVALGQLAHVHLSHIGQRVIPSVTTFHPAEDIFTVTRFNHPLVPKYIFHQSDIQIVNKLMTEIRNSRESGKFNAFNEALRRFNSSYSGEPEDRLIDQMIAFESLYLGYDQELKYRLAMRVAFLLGEGRGRDRKCIYRDVKNAYDYRSDIVHGNKQVNMSKLEEIIPKTEEYLRLTIKRYFSLFAKGYSLESIRQGTKEKNALLDENILNNGKTLALRE